ncbi:MAG: hypothetical protein WAV16_02370 [Candidatus Moraniibacteriota bacterium]
MKKTYWWRVLLSFFAAIGITIGEITFYPYKYGLCKDSLDNCAVSVLRKSFSEPLFIFAVALFFTSLFLFFVSNNIFTKWFKFASIYTVFAWLAILITPVYPGGFMDPNREQVSIWMSGLFLIISLILIIIWHIKERKSLK